MIEITTRRSRAARLKRRLPMWMAPVAGMIGLLAVVITALINR